MPITVRLPNDIEKRLADLAKETGRSKAFYIREMILKNIDDIEDYYLAAHISELVRQGKEAVLSSDQVRSELAQAD